MDIALQVKERVMGQGTGDKHEGQDRITDRSDQKPSHKLSVFSILQDVERVDVAPPGFINFKISEAKLSSQLTEVIKQGEGYGKAKEKSATYPP